MNELLDSNENKPHLNSNYKNIIIANMVILVIYTLYSFLTIKGEGAILDAFFIAAHVGICIILGIILTIASQSDWAKGFYLSALLVLLIGFGTCLGLATL